MKRVLSLALSAVMITAFAGCGQNSGSPTSQPKTTAQTEPATTIAVKSDLPKPDNSKWQYLPNEKIYYQLGIDYCEKPADEKYEKLSIFVPAEYMDATDNGDGTYTCSEKKEATVGSYTSADAPIVLPVETPSYYAAEALTSDMPENALNYFLDKIKEYTSQGMVYIFPGCRGIDEGAPSGVTDLKAAVRYIRYCDDELAGDANRIFAFGMSGGGAQAAILGASGNSELYDPYLKEIGAVQGVSDKVAGVMAWCPITDLDTANAEYEWMMGCTRKDRSAEENAISDELAKAFAEYINQAGFTDKDGNALTLTESKEGIFQAGSYYDYIKSVIEGSLNHYLSDTVFDSPDLKNSYGSAQGYIDSLNKDKKWVTYDKATNTAVISSIADFAKECKNASENQFAFDTPQSENNLFGTGDGKGSHFDKILGDILSKLNNEAAADFAEDFKKTDAQGSTLEQRVNMYTPLYYLMEKREGFGTSDVSENWRIRTGIKQINTSVTTEANLALALEHNSDVKSVDFETVWEQTHEEAERTGDSTENFIEWIGTCTQ